jgi:hypothetical protein
MHKPLNSAAGELRHRGRQRAEGLAEHRCGIAWIAGENLVRAHACQKHGVCWFRLSRENEMGDNRRIGERLVELPQHFGQESDNIRIDFGLAQFCSERCSG